MKKSRFSDQQIAFALTGRDGGRLLRMSAGSSGYARRCFIVGRSATVG